MCHSILTSIAGISRRRQSITHKNRERTNKKTRLKPNENLRNRALIQLTCAALLAATGRYHDRSPLNWFPLCHLARPPAPRPQQLQKKHHRGPTQAIRGTYGDATS